MFNKNLREEAINNLKRQQKEYEQQNNNLIKDAEKLFEIRIAFKSIIDESWDFVNSFRNKPVDLDTELKTIKVETKKFANLVDNLELEMKKANIASGGTAASGVAAGVGVAAFGPTAAMAIATTFGTASTGTAIATLSWCCCNKCRASLARGRSACCRWRWNSCRFSPTWFSWSDWMGDWRRGISNCGFTEKW